MTMNQESLAADHGSCFAWQDRHGAYLHLIFTRKLDGAKKASFTFAYFFNYFATCIPRFAHGNCSKYILHYKDFNSIVLLFSISILFLEPYAAACLVLLLSS